MSATTLEELAELLPAHITAAQRVLLDAARGFANEAGVIAARNELRDALEAISAKQDAVRVCREEQRAARDELADALAEATWAVESQRLVVEGPRTRYWVTDDDDTAMVANDDGTASPRPTGAKKRISVTADRGKELVEQEVRRRPAVRDAQRAVDRAADATQTAIEAVGSAERRFSAAKHDLDAAVAHLNLLALALPRGER